MKRIYISGGITGVKNYAENFRKMERELIRLGYFPINPVKHSEGLRKKLGREPTYDEYLKFDLEILETCDNIIFLPGAEKSKGSNIEREFAKSKNIPTIKIMYVK